jgi:hypothetical protein
MQQICLSLYSKNSTIASGATPIGSAGRAPDEDGNYRLHLEDKKYGLHIGVTYRLHCQNDENHTLKLATSLPSRGICD